MKKLMITAAAALCATVGFSEGISSSNCVGYMNDSKVRDNNFITVQFNNIGYNTASIQQIKISDPNGVMASQGGIGWMTEYLQVWEGVPVVVDDATYFYLDPSNDPVLYSDHPEDAQTDYYWGDAACNKIDFNIDPGAGVVIGTVVDGLKVTITSPYSL